uniref:Cathepsin propeptide inhibitor domain-containing protein n=1 Tax=Brassica oleracea var. oleracea TaxID=109376 RepID=A0A0D3B2G1_BRAOL
MSVSAMLLLVVLVILMGSHDSTPIPDDLQKVEESFVQILGQSNHVLSFARFNHKYGKKYQHAEEIKHRFSVFKENLDLIRSTNNKGLSYKLGVNTKQDISFFSFFSRALRRLLSSSPPSLHVVVSSGKQVHYKFELMEETLYLTINLIDMFLAVTQHVPRKKLQLVGEVNGEYIAIQLLSANSICVHEEVSQSCIIWQEGELLSFFIIEICLVEYEML